MITVYKKYLFEPEPIAVDIKCYKVRIKGREYFLFSGLKNPIITNKIRIMVIFAYAVLVATIVLIELFLSYRDSKHQNI